MPEVLRDVGFSIRVYVRDEHPPPHVHVLKAGADVRIKLGRLGDEPLPPELWDVEGLISSKDVRKAVMLVGKHHAACIAVWEDYHGPA